MKETWTTWIINRTTQAQRMTVLLGVAVVLAFAIFMCLSTN